METKVYYIKAVTGEGQTNPRDPQDKTEYMSVQLQDVSKGRKHRGSRTVPFVTFFANNQADKETIEAIKEARSDQNQDDSWNYDPKLLGEVTLEGIFMKKRVHPYYVLDNQGNVQKYRQNHQDAGKPVIADTLPIFLFTDDIENADAIVQRQMNGRKLVDLESTDVGQYTNMLAKSVLKKAKAEQQESEEDTVEA